MSLPTPQYASALFPPRTHQTMWEWLFSVRRKDQPGSPVHAPKGSFSHVDRWYGLHRNRALVQFCVFVSGDCSHTSPVSLSRTAAPPKSVKMVKREVFGQCFVPIPGDVCIWVFLHGRRGDECTPMSVAYEAESSYQRSDPDFPFPFALHDGPPRTNVECCPRLRSVARILPHHIS